MISLYNLTQNNHSLLLSSSIPSENRSKPDLSSLSLPCPCDKRERRERRRERKENGKRVRI